MRLNPSVKEKYPELAIGYAIARNVKVEKVKKGLEDEKKVVTKEIQIKYGSTPILEIPDVKAYRTFYKMLGVLRIKEIWSNLKLLILRKKQKLKNLGRGSSIHIIMTIIIHFLKVQLHYILGEVLKVITIGPCQ